MKLTAILSALLVLSINAAAQDQDSVYVKSCISGRSFKVLKSEASSFDLIEYDSKKLFGELGTFHQVMGSISIAASIGGIIAITREKSISRYYYIPVVAVGLLGVWEFGIGRDLKKYSNK